MSSKHAYCNFRVRLFSLLKLLTQFTLHRIYMPLQARLHPPHSTTNTTSFRPIRQRLALAFLGLADLGIAFSYHISSCPVALVLTWPNAFNALVVGSWVYIAYDNFLLALTLRMNRGCICSEPAVSREKNTESQAAMEDDGDKETTPLLDK